MKKIKLFLNPILYYMEDSSGFASPHYINFQNGEIVSPDFDDGISHEDVKDEERYLRIEPITSHEGYGIMQDFAVAEDSDEIRALLFDALERKKPFHNFKNAIAEYPDTQKKFYAYKDRRLKEIFRDQLAERGYEVAEETF
ncbi:MAG: hypothetical protein JRI75_09140 [Deltaproteobacteria bacterium]|nr:hypothetical protein [Deltaproteobacteria bacterium]